MGIGEAQCQRIASSLHRQLGNVRVNNLQPAQTLWSLAHDPYPHEPLVQERGP